MSRPVPRVFADPAGAPPPETPPMPDAPPGSQPVDPGAAPAEHPAPHPPAASVAPSAEAPRPLSPEFLHQLRFEHLRSLSALSVSATGGGLIALEAGLFERTPLVAIPILCFGLAAVVSLLTQRQLVQELTTQGRTGRSVHVMGQLAEMLLGMGVGAALAILLV